jgi:hypothetical protein
MKVSKHYPKKYRLFLDLAVKETEYSEEQIGDLLKANFGTFNLADLQKYRDYIYGLEEAEELRKSIREQARKEERQQCPVCGSYIRFAHDRAGRFSGIAEWVCDKGGLTHYIENKTNEIVRLQNKKYGENKPLPFPVFVPEVTDGDSPGSVNAGVGSSGSGGSSEDHGVDTRMDSGIRGASTGGSSNCTPNRLRTET